MKKNSSSKIVAKASASLALVKYWGKQNRGINIPSTTSIAVTLKGLDSSTQIQSKKTHTNFTEEEQFTLTVNNKTQDTTRTKNLCYAMARHYGINIKGIPFQIKANNSFPSSAGLASSSSGGAALATAFAKILKKSPSKKQLSCFARIYSGSACRSIFGGFVEWQKGSKFARPLTKSSFWKDFRVIVVAVTKNEKKISSRDAMNLTKTNSPYYSSWITYNNSLCVDAKKAIKTHDIQKLGEIAIKSYTAMHASALSAYPPVLYWSPSTLSVLREIRTLQHNNIAVWETMDAGPQIKLITLSHHVKKITTTLRACVPSAWIKTCTVGGDAFVH